MITVIVRSFTMQRVYVGGEVNRQGFVNLTAGMTPLQAVLEAGRPDLKVLAPGQLMLVRRLVAILRVADALDRSHSQPVLALRASVPNGRVRVVARARAALDLELWDVAREAGFFRQALGRRLEVEASRR